MSSLSPRWSLGTTDAFMRQRDTPRSRLNHISDMSDVCDLLTIYQNSSEADEV
jgi:hypothetical protein